MMKVFLTIIWAACAAEGFFLPQGGPLKKATTSWRLYASSEPPKRVVVIGNGPVGQRLTENLVSESKAADVPVEVVSFCEEKHSCYNRVILTKWFEDRKVQSISMVGEYDAEGVGSYYREQDVAKVRVNEKADEIDLERRVVKGPNDDELPYDVAVLATGSYPFVPPIQGKELDGIFVYRTVDDLEKLVQYCADHQVTSAAVIGGGLLGLEAAKAVHDLGCKTSILEYAPILLCRQIDQGGHNALKDRVEDLGLNVVCDARVSKFSGEDGKVTKVEFSNDDWKPLDVGVVVVSAGIRPRDEVARKSNLNVHERGGVIVDDSMRTSDPRVYAVGEVALHRGKIYGLVAPGYQQASVAAKNIINDLSSSSSSEEQPSSEFHGADVSTKLKLLGCDVASFGMPQKKDNEKELVWNDPASQVYRKLIVDDDNVLVGGVLVGDAGDYSELYQRFKAGTPLDVPAATLLPPPSVLHDVGGSFSGMAATEDDADPTKQICSCNDVTRGEIVAAIQIQGDKTTYGDLKQCTKAGSGCGGCEPDVKKILKFELEKMGAKVTNHVCEHFPHSRPELMAIAKSKNITTFEELLKEAGTSTDGCEICKPAVASILATLENRVILDDGRAALQDTNDRSLANMQRGGTYSVVPRIPGGAIHPDALIGIGKVAKDYDLYTKVTGAQRIDLFGAKKQDLPDIWERLGQHGLESGHAYGKALRTVKSCVGSSWCRYGVQNSVDFAIQVEHRYKGLRAPHKLKSAVSGCTRECAEASCKDFGMIATENGYDLYLCGNGGANPRHGVLFASGIDETTVLRYLDRFLMYYCLTGERLERTARWFERLGPNDDVRLKALQDVVIHDSLGMNAEFEERMQKIVDTYHDEWQVVVQDDDLRSRFKQFLNTDETQDIMDFVDDGRTGQKRPVDWAKDGEPQTNWAVDTDIFRRSEKTWIDFGPVDAFPQNIGSAVLYGESQLAIFRTASNEWFATQNMCPHKHAFVLAEGIVGLTGSTPKVACPLHKKQFNLNTGKQLDGDLDILTFPVRIEKNRVELYLPNRQELDAVLATSKLRVTCANGAARPVPVAR